MGACCGVFNKRNDHKRQLSLRRCVYRQGQDRVELQLLVDEELEHVMDDDSLAFDVWTMSKGSICMFILNEFLAFVESDMTSTRLKSKPWRIGRQNRSTNNAEQVDHAAGGQQLHSLDAYSLLASRAMHNRTTSCCSSTPPSSIDLEWENECALQSLINRPKSLHSSTVDDGFSLHSRDSVSPESLEWDPVVPTSSDYETERLIEQIEQLTRQALQETGDWTKRGSRKTRAEDNVREKTF